MTTQLPNFGTRLTESYLALAALSTLLITSTAWGSDQETGFSKEVALLCRGFLETDQSGRTSERTSRNALFRASIKSRPDPNAKKMGVDGFEDVRLSIDNSLVTLKSSPMGSYMSCSAYGLIISCEKSQRSKVEANSQLSKGTPLEGREVFLEEEQKIKLERDTGLMRYDYAIKTRYTNPSELITLRYSGAFECEVAKSRRF